LIKSFVGEAVAPFTSEKPEKSFEGVLQLYLLAFIVSSGSVGCLIYYRFFKGSLSQKWTVWKRQKGS
jgi:hypothetical protein